MKKNNKPFEADHYLKKAQEVRYQHDFKQADHVYQQSLKGSRRS